MELYIYYTLIFFSGVIQFLYLYLLYDKLHTAILSKLKARYIRLYSQRIDCVMDGLLGKCRHSKEDLAFMKKYLHKRLIQEIFIEKILEFIEVSGEKPFPQLSGLCEELGFVGHEIDTLKSRDTFMVALACKTLGEFRSKQAVQPLLRCLNSYSLDIVYHALSALAKIGDEGAFVMALEESGNVPLLTERSLIEIADSFEGNRHFVCKTMMKSPNEYLASVFIKAAGNLKDRTLGSTIAAFLTDENKEIRIAASKALGTLGDARYTGELVKLLTDAEWEVRALAAGALGSIKSPLALNPLKKALSDRQWHVRFNAAGAILAVPGGLKTAARVFLGNDPFAKDILMSAMENLRFAEALSRYEASGDVNEQRSAKIIRNYMAKVKE